MSFISWTQVRESFKSPVSKSRVSGGSSLQLSEQTPFEKVDFGEGGSKQSFDLYKEKKADYILVRIHLPDQSVKEGYIHPNLVLNLSLSAPGLEIKSGEEWRTLLTSSKDQFQAQNERTKAPNSTRPIYSAGLFASVEAYRNKFKVS